MGADVVPNAEGIEDLPMHAEKQEYKMRIVERLPRLSWELDLRPGDSGSTLRDGLLHVNGFA